MNRLAIEIIKSKELEKEFEQTVALVNNNKGKVNVSTLQLTNIYGLYKQATYGDNNHEAPYAIQATAYAKWSAWNKYKGLKPSEAKRQYIDYVKPILA